MISIVIPTRNRSSNLAECLAALHRERDALGMHEIIVVDDGSGAAEQIRNRRRCEEHQAGYLLQERCRGMAVTRNRGIRQTRGEWVVFIDDDVTVDFGWGAVLVRELQRAPEQVIGIEGKVTGLGDGLWDREVEVLSGGACLTCHIAYRKPVLLTAGCFDERFAIEGPFHEDQELAARMQRFGDIEFCDELAAFHQPRNLRLVQQLTGASARIEKVLRADFYFFRKNPDGYRRFRFAKTFNGTYTAVLLKYAWTTLRRRTVAALLRHPVQTLVLVAASLLAQLRAWMLLPYFIARNRKSARPKELWFAAAIPENSQGGVRRLMEGLAGGMGVNGYRTEILCREYRKGGYLLFSLVLAFKLMLRIFSPPAWIIARSTDAFFPLLVRRVLPVPTGIILQNHGWEEYVFEVQRRLPRAIVDTRVTWKAQLLRFPLLRATLGMADYCLCGTVADMRWIANRYPEQRSKLRYVPNGVAIVPEQTSTQQLPEPSAFLNVGTMTWRKNHAYTVELFKGIVSVVPEARLYCVGTGRMPQNGIHPDISCIPSVPMDAIGQWYRRCPFFIHTSRYEGGHALVLLEAMAHGAVCFVSPEPSNREVVVDGRNGIVLDGCDSGKDIERILAVVNDTTLCRELSVNARSTALRHRWERQVTRLMRVLPNQ
jgi:glycosyltransferase involved in cell wall biosynthesis